MIKNLAATIAGFLTSFLYTTNAFARGGGGAGGDRGAGGGGGEAAATPEIDGPGALMAVALLVSLGVMAYRKAQT